MPRPLRQDRCQPCRSRKIKCDGHRPVCLRCQRGSHGCHWTPSVTVDVTREEQGGNSGLVEAYVSAKDPGTALQDPRVARIFRYYIDHLASWYDLNDSKRHFEDNVPDCARRNPLLLSAILAFSAASQNSSFPNTQLGDLADAYHLESVQILLSLTGNLNEFRTGETLTAICLLRSYEIITQNVSAQNHLRGSYSLLTSCPNDLGPGLIRAGFWNYLREDITVALIEKRNLMIELNDPHPPRETNCEDDFANHITYILGRIINRCLQQQGIALGRSEWAPLKEELDNWMTSLPSSFETIATPRICGESSFPSLWNTSKWHTSSLQYYHVAMIILSLAEPITEPTNTLQHIERMKSLQGKLEYHAIQVSALAVSSNSAAVWVNAFGPISFCGPWLRQSRMLTELTGELQNWGEKTGWPVSNIIKSLVESDHYA